jgi:2-(1,2-epoxy-1,2-dihydrophenyl)acetyl-CoA isomerase
MTDHIKSSVADGIGTILFNRPESLNAASAELVDGFVEITQAFERDPDVRCVVIKGAGEHFMAGGDIKDFHHDVSRDQNAHASTLEKRVIAGQLAYHRLRRMHKPVLVSVQGATAGLGISILTAGDLAIAADDAIFSLAYRHIGLSADGGVSYFLPRIVGERRALEIALLGEQFPAAKALDWGLVNWVVPKADLAAQTGRIARLLADGPREALGHIKRLFRTSLDNSWGEQSAREAESISALAATADHLEGLTAFLEKRKPRFSSK